MDVDTDKPAGYVTYLTPTGKITPIEEMTLTNELEKREFPKQMDM